MLSACQTFGMAGAELPCPGCVTGSHSTPWSSCRPLGYCIRVREAVTDLARVLLRMCEEYAIIITEPAVHQHHHQHHHLHVHAGGQAAGVEAGGGGHGGAATAR